MDTSSDADSQQVKHHLLVCISTNTDLAQRLIQHGHELATKLQADWIVLHIQRPAYHRYPKDIKDQMSQLLNLAESYGAKTDTVFGASVADEILGYAQKHGITTVILGRPRKAWIFNTVVRRVLQQGGEIDVHTVGQTAPPSHTRKREPTAFTPLHYVYALALVALVSIVCFPLTACLIPRTSSYCICSQW